MNTCIECGKHTSNPKYCSRSCSATSNNRGLNRNKKIWETFTHCLNCSSEITGSGRKYCAKKCSNEHRIISTYEYYLNNQHEYSDVLYSTNSIKPHILKEQNYLCIICSCENTHNGLPLVFILDHIDGNAKNNLRVNLRCVCPNCDSQLDTYKSKNKNSARAGRYNKY